MQEGTAAEVLERLRAGDARAFEDLVVAYQHRVFSIAYRMLGSRAEAEEAAQEVFLGDPPVNAEKHLLRGFFGLAAAAPHPVGHAEATGLGGHDQVLEGARGAGPAPPQP